MYYWISENDSVVLTLNSQNLYKLGWKIQLKPPQIARKYFPVLHGSDMYLHKFQWTFSPFLRPFSVVMLSTASRGQTKGEMMVSQRQAVFVYFRREYRTRR